MNASQIIMEQSFGTIFGLFAGISLWGVLYLWYGIIVKKESSNGALVFTNFVLLINVVFYKLCGENRNPAFEDAHTLAMIGGIYVGQIITKVNLLRAEKRRSKLALQA